MRTYLLVDLHRTCKNVTTSSLDTIKLLPFCQKLAISYVTSKLKNKYHVFESVNSRRPAIPSLSDDVSKTFEVHVEKRNPQSRPLFPESV